MPPSSALSLPVSAAPARQLSRANRPRKRKSSAAEFLFCAPAAFTNMLHKTDGSHTNRLLFFLEEKKQKKINCGTAFSSALLPLSPTCYTKRTVHIRTVRFYTPSRTCGKPPFLRKTPSPAVSFVSFLQEKKSSPLPFLSRKKRKQKKVICGTVFSAAVAFFANMQHKTDGSYVNRPFLCSKQDVRESAFSPKDPSPPQCLLFLFFKKRKRTPFKKRKRSPLLEEKKPSPLSRSAPRRSAADRPRRNTRS